MGKEAEQKQEIVNQGVHTYSQEEIGRAHV